MTQWTEVELPKGPDGLGRSNLLMNGEPFVAEAIESVVWNILALAAGPGDTYEYVSPEGKTGPIPLEKWFEAHPAPYVGPIGPAPIGA